jgi:NAD(P)-dependent dehydrogenase (short-subunit alcohol dehydrogenase family)
MPPGLRLADRKCLIVGGTSGIGLASARRFLEEGAKVVVCGRSVEGCEAAIPPLELFGPRNVHAITADASDPDSVDFLFRRAAALLDGRIDVLFHVAGISGRRFGDGPLHECSVEGWDAVLAANARSTFLTNRAAVRCMLKQEPDEFGLRGTVLNMGSVLGRSPAPDYFGTLAYAASKGAVESMTLAAAARYARDGVRFNMIAPALIETPMSARACGDPAIREYLAAKQPMAGGPGAVEDCAEAALYLCEPASRFVTGVVLNVDGGWCVSEGRLPDVRRLPPLAPPSSSEGT